MNSALVTSLTWTSLRERLVRDGLAIVIADAGGGSAVVDLTSHELAQLQSLLVQLHSGFVRTVPLSIAPVITSEMTLHDVYALFRLSPGRYPDAIARAWLTLCRALPHEMTVRALAVEVAIGRLILRDVRQLGSGTVDVAEAELQRVVPDAFAPVGCEAGQRDSGDEDNRDLAATISCSSSQLGETE